MESPNQEEQNLSTGRPPMFSSLVAEGAFVCVCSVGQFLFALHLANTFVNQITLVDALGITEGNTPWLIGSFLVANGVSVTISGSLSDLISPKWLVIAAFVWMSVWNIVGTFSLLSTPYPVLFFWSRAMIGVAVGTVCSASMSMLGRVYRPGQRKNQVFSLMGAMIPLGFSVGAVQGGALSSHLEWLFGSCAVFCAFCSILAWCYLPDLETESLSLPDFDWLGAVFGVAGSGLLIFGLTQGVPSHWSPYTYTLVIVGLACLVLFAIVECRVSRPLIDHRIWSVPGFIPLMIAYFLGYGAYCGTWQLYAVRFLLTIQEHSPMTVGAYLTTIGISGTIASWVVSKLLHRLPGHFILIASMVAFALGATFFLPQTAATPYWALTFPGFILSTFGPDMSFAAISVFITSNMPKTYQGAAAGLLLTSQNLSTALMAAIGDTIATSANKDGGFTLTLDALRATWWFSLATCITSAVICIVFVRIPKSEEKGHVQ